MNNLRLVYRIMAALGVTLLIVAGLAGGVKLALEEIDDALGAITDVAYPKTERAIDIIKGVDEVGRIVRDQVILDSVAERKARAAEIAPISAQISKHIAALKAEAENDAQRRLIANYESARAEYLTTMRQILNLAQAGETDEARQLVNAKMPPAESAYLGAVSRIIQSNSETIKSAGDNAQDRIDSTSRLLLIMLIAAVVSIGLLGLWLVPSITRPIRRCVTAAQAVAAGRTDLDLDVTRRDEAGELMQAMQEMASRITGVVEEVTELSAAAVRGDLSDRADETKHEGQFARVVEAVNATLDAVVRPLDEATQVLEKLADSDMTARVCGDYAGDHARIKRSINSAADVLHDALAQVARASDEVQSASAEVASSSQSIAQGATEQAASLEETASSLEEMSSIIRVSATKSSEASSLAQHAKASAEGGQQAMDRMLQSMSEIRSGAESTASIIKDINEVAFQTNLLALNAAVEAARAGEAGRGFAVVAEEVRSLAMRSKEAAAKTETLIRESIVLAGEGTNSSVDVQHRLSEILEKVAGVTTLVGEIARSGQEQATGIDQVNRAVAQVESVVQSSAANAEETSGAAEEMAGQSRELADMVSRFKLRRDGGASRPHAAPSIPPRRGTRSPSGAASANHLDASPLF